MPGVSRGNQEKRAGRGERRGEVGDFSREQEEKAGGSWDRQGEVLPPPLPNPSPNLQSLQLGGLAPDLPPHNHNPHSTHFTLPG